MSTAYRRWLVALALPLLLKLGDHYVVAASSSGDVAEIRADRLPLQVGQWRGVEQAVTPKAVAPLARDAVVQRTYRSAAGETVSVALIYSNKWEGLHPPQHCLVAGGWKIVRETTTAIRYPGGPRQTQANVVTAESDEGGRLVELYLFADARGTSASWIEQYLALLSRNGRAGGKSSCLILVAHETPTPSDEAQAIDLTARFVERFVPYVQDSLRG